MKHLEYRCPKCGEPPRSARVLAMVDCVFMANGKLGPIYAYQKVVPKPESKEIILKCGGNHTWPVDYSAEILSNSE